MASLSFGVSSLNTVERLKTSQMFTNAGMIGQIQATWEGERPGVRYASPAGELPDEQGRPLRHKDVARLDNLSGDLYRKFCSRCHLSLQNDSTESNGHPAGCAACHFPYGEGAVYRGGDRTMRGRSPHGATHALAGLPPMRACLAAPRVSSSGLVRTSQR